MQTQMTPKHKQPASNGSEVSLMYPDYKTRMEYVAASVYFWLEYDSGLQLVPKG